MELRKYLLCLEFVLLLKGKSRWCSAGYIRRYSHLFCSVSIEYSNFNEKLVDLLLNGLLKK